MTVRQKLEMILENKVVQKYKLKNNVLCKKWSPKLILSFYFDIKNLFRKYDFGTFWWIVIHKWISKKNHLSMLTLGQKSSFLVCIEKDTNMTLSLWLYYELVALTKHVCEILP